MLHVLSYDVTDDGRRRRVADALKDFGRRVQYSVFECDVDAGGLRELSVRLAREIDVDEDSVRVYRICSGCIEVMTVLGKGDRYEKKGFFIV